LRGLFVTGTDTGVGKTILAGAITAALHADGLDVRVLKPVITGLEEPGPADHEVLAHTAGCQPEEVAVVSYDPPMSPHLAAELAERPIAPDALEDAVAEKATGGEVVVVEGVGGLLVPLTDSYDVRALARALALPLLIAARPGLGTINHTLLTLEVARAAGLEVTAVVLTPWPEEPDEIERSNRDTIERLGNVEVATLPQIERAERGPLAEAGRELPIERWLGASESKARGHNRSDRGAS
jgi:dethiobiotin synthetase